MSDQPEEKTLNTQEKSCSSQNKKGRVFFFIVIGVIIIGALAYVYWRSTPSPFSVAKINTDSKNQPMMDHDAMVMLQKSVSDLQAVIQQSQALSVQSLPIGSALPQGDADNERVLEARHWVKLANDQLQFLHDFSMAVTLLQRADRVLDTVHDSNALALRQLLASDITHLQAAPEVNITALYLQLNALNKQIDQLPLPINPMKVASPPDLSTPEETTWPWWKRGLHQSWQMLQHIVVVRYNDARALPLVLPEEKIFLYQNLHAQFESILWAVLYRNTEVYQASLERAINWIQQYFLQEAPLTKTVLQQLQALQQVNIEQPSANLAETLTRFDQYVASSGQQKEHP